MSAGRILLSVDVAGLPPSVNHMYRSSGGARYRYKVKSAREWQDMATAILAKAWGDKKPYTEDVELQLELHRRDRHAYDVDNRIKAVQDCLEYARVIKNDTQVTYIRARKLYDRDSPSYTKIILREC